MIFHVDIVIFRVEALVDIFVVVVGEMFVQVGTIPSICLGGLQLLRSRVVSGRDCNFDEIVGLHLSMTSIQLRPTS